MKKTSENRFSMILTVLQVCAKHVATWTGLVPYKSAHDELVNNSAAIKAATQKQEQVLIGIALDKRFKKDGMVKRTVDVAQAVFAYAVDQGDLILQEKANYSRSDLYKERDTVIGQVCQNIHGLANAAIAALGAYGVVAADLTALQTAIDAYVNVVASPRTALTVRKGATAEIDLLVRNSMKILNSRMDKLMPEFETSAPTFFQEYFDARIIVDLGGKEEKTAEAA
ncbi:MAG: hypothetical protein ABI599_02815 [Flavobacteriales bacterium]